MVKARHSRLQKSWITRWSWVLVLAVLTMCMSLLILLLLALHLLSMPNTNTSFAPFKHNHLNSIARNASYMYSLYSFTCFLQFLFFLLSFFLFHFSAEAKEKMNRQSDGLKYYHGSLGLFSITIFWSVFIS